MLRLPLGLVRPRLLLAHDLLTVTSPYCPRARSLPSIMATAKVTVTMKRRRRAT